MTFQPAETAPTTRSSLGPRAHKRKRRKPRRGRYEPNLIKTQISVQEEGATRWPAKRILLLCLVLAAAAAVVQVSEASDEPTAGANRSPPRGSSCILEVAPERDDFPAIGLKRSNASDRLVQLTKHTVQFIRNQPNQSQYRNQIAFESICNGWRNSLAHELDQKPPGYWVFDRSLGALVAKFNIQNPLDLISSPEARLTSPVFRPIPADNLAPVGQFKSSCRLTFSSYKTTDTHLDLTLIIVPSGGSSKSYQQQQPATKATKQANFLWLRQINDKGSVGRQLAAERGEQAAWTNHSVELPEYLSGKFYRLQFSALSTPIKSNPPATSYLSGVAIANFSLSPQCFDLADDTPFSELSGEPDASLRSRLAEFLTANGLSILIGVIIILLLVIVSAQYLLCASYQQQQQQQQQLRRRRSEVAWWLQVLCCWCCHLGGAKSSKALAKQRQRHRVYAAKQNNGFDSGDSKAPKGSIEGHLRPLQGGLFESVELNENPNYMANGVYLSLPAGQFQYSPSGRRSSGSVPLAQHQIGRKRLTLTKPLGKGTFGEVYQGCLVCYCEMESSRHQFQLDKNAELDHPDSHSVKVAVKTLTDKKMSQDDFIREAVYMSQVSHRNIVEFYGVCFEESPLYIVMELLQGGNLKSFLLKNRDKGSSPSGASQQQLVQLAGLAPPADSAESLGRRQSASPQTPDQTRVRLSIGDLLVFALDIARACDYMQQRKFIHRDLAARNCLLSAGSKMAPWSPAGSPEPGQTAWRNFAASPPSALDVEANHKLDLESVYLNGFQNSGIVAKLADFGMSRDVYTSDYYQVNHKELPVRWMPPECLDGVATSKSDVWSFGVFLWELFSMGQMPYQNLLDNHLVIEFIRSRRYARPRQPSPVARRPAADLLLTIPDEAANQGAARRPEPEPELESEPELEAESEPLPPPLPPPHDNTPYPVYAIMCACWATNPDDRPQFEEIANRLYWCLQNGDVLAASLPCFYEPAQGAHLRSESRSTMGANGSQSTQVTQLNW